MKKINSDTTLYPQAVLIIRSKITVSADQALSEYNMALIVDAIIDRLDHAYADRRPIHILEQEMNVMRQGKLRVDQYYDRVEMQLTLITTKVIMEHKDQALTDAFLNKYRNDALRTFISGLDPSIGNVIFSKGHTDMPTALAMAQELESNCWRYRFVNSFADFQSGIQSNLSAKKVQPFKQNFAPTVPLDKGTPMNVDPSLSHLRKLTQPQRSSNAQNSQYKPMQTNNNPIPSNRTRTSQIQNVHSVDVEQIE